MATKVEATNNELVIKSPDGNVAIIKPEDATKVQQLIDAEDYEAVNSIVNSYPSAQDYAADGSLYVGGVPPKNQNQLAEGGSLINPPADEPLVDPEYNKYLGETQFNTSEDLDKWNLQMQGKVGEDKWNLGQTPYQDLAKSQKFSDKYYGAGAKQFSSLIGEEAVTDLRTRRQSFLDEGLSTSEMTGKLSSYARDTYGDQFINKEDVYGDFGPKETAIMREAGSRLRTRRGLYGDATKAGTAGNLDVDDTKFGFRNFINPQFIQNQQNYKDIWQPEGTQRLTLQEKTNQNAKGGPIKAEDGLTIKKDPSEKGILETATDYVSDAAGYVSNLFGSESDKKGKKLTRLPKGEGSIRMDVSNYPEFGLTNVQSVEDYYSSDVKEYVPRIDEKTGKRTGKLENLQVYDLPNKFACTGSSCRAVKHRFPGLKNARDVLSDKYGFSAFTETSSTTGVEDPGFDAWEIQQALRTSGLGTDLFTSKTGTKGETGIKLTDKEKTSRVEAIKNFDPSTISIGAILGAGSSISQKYTKKGGKTFFKDKEGKEIDLTSENQQPQHSMSVVGFDDATGDTFVYDYGTNRRIGDSEAADYTWAAFLEEKEINSITSVDDNASWTYEGLKQGRKQIATQKEIKSKTK